MAKNHIQKVLDQYRHSEIRINIPLLERKLEELGRNAICKLAIASDVSHSCIAKMLAKEVPKKAANRARIANALGVETWKLFLNDRT